MKDVAEEDRRAEAAPQDPLESVQEILGILFHLPEMRVGKDGHSAVDVEGLWERRHGEILPAAALLSFEPSSMTRISNARADSAPNRFAPATGEPIVAASLKQGKNIVRLGRASVGTTPILSGPT
jgi:hypothetical protein